MGRRVFAITALFAAGSATSLAAQEVDRNPPDVEPSSQICVVPLTRWVPTPEQTARIQLEPVPEQFVRMFESGPCNTLDRAGLLDWHIKFGDERSAAAALAFYAAHWTPSPVNAGRYAAALEEAWDLARPRFEAVKRLRSEDQRQAADDLRLRDGRILQLDRIMAIADGYQTLFDYTLRAADFFRSPRLLTQAEALVPVIEARIAFYETHRATFEELRDFALFDPRRIDNFASARLLPLRLAGARSRILGAPVNRQEARAAVVGPYNNAIAEAGDLAWKDAGIDRVRDTNFDALKAAVDAEDDFLRFAVQVLFEDVRLALGDAGRDVGMKCDPSEFHETMILLEQFEKDGRDQGIPLGYSGHSYPADFRDMRLELLLARADCTYSHAVRLADGRDFDQADDRFFETFEAVDQARQLVQPDESPARFRAIAELYREATGRCRVMSASASATGREAHCSLSINSRLETYFRVSLDALDRIATAAISRE